MKNLDKQFGVGQTGTFTKPKISKMTKMAKMAKMGEITKVGKKTKRKKKKSKGGLKSENAGLKKRLKESI